MAFAVAVTAFEPTSAFGQADADGLPSVAQRPPAVEFGPPKLVERRGAIGEYALEYPSPVRTALAINNTVHGRLVRPDGEGPFPVVIVLHYWGAANLEIERALADELAARGIAALMIDLPYHLQRSPSNVTSGSLAIRPDPQAMVETMTQATLDVRRAVDWIGTRPELDATRLGVFGTSLGAIVAALVYGVEERVRYGGFLLGGVDLAGILWRSPLVVQTRKELRRRRVTEDSLREALRPIEPLTHLRRSESGDAFVVGARYDLVVPAGNTQRLIEALPSPYTVWLDTGHYGGVFVQRPIFRAMADFFRAKFAGEAFAAPRSFLAPTVRLGVTLNPQTGVQIAAGADVWRSNARGDATATVLVTPRGGQLFVGRRLDRSFAVGVTFTTRRTGFGVFWSTVL
ncbi:MAG: dienelactone hydrolase family protein [Fimbriimonadaceae bacterium]|nr:dienelactone hydrolase family protein [Fimbriimonadaceae bacterium]